MPRTSDRRISHDSELFSGDDKNSGLHPANNTLLHSRQLNHNYLLVTLMDLDAFNKIKAKERQYCYTNRLCFYCKAPGHDVDNCEKKKAANAR
jgi:hypothetical protein